jgi:hypothetical protein
LQIRASEGKSVEGHGLQIRASENGMGTDCKSAPAEESPLKGTDCKSAPAETVWERIANQRQPRLFRISDKNP